MATGNPATKRRDRNPSSSWLLFSLIALLSIGTLAVLPGCGGGDDSGSDSSDEGGSSKKLDERKEQAEDAKKDAEKAEAKKYAPKEWASAMTQLEKAEDRDRVSDYTRARDRFRTAKKAAEKNRKNMQAFFELEEEYTKLRDEAKKANADTLLKDTWDYAEKSYAAAKKQAEDGKSSSKTTIRRAIGDMKLAIEEVQKKAKFKKRAEEALALATAAEQTAVTGEAEKHAAVDLDYARNTLREGRQALEDSEFQKAERLLMRAKGDFAFALENATRAKQGIELAQRQPEPTNPGDGDGDLASGNGGDGGVETPIGDIDRPNPGGSSDDGDTDIGDVIAELPNLFHGNPEYRDGLLRLSYEQDGDSFQKDTLVTAGKVGTNVVFKGVTHTGTEDYTFAGNETGALFVKAGYKDKVRMSVDLQLQLWGAEATRYIEMLAFWNPRNNSGYAFQLGNFGLVAISYKDGNPTASKRAPKYKKDANTWLSRRESHVFTVTIKPEESSRSSDKVKNILTVEFNGEEVIKMTANNWDKGLCGFRWKDGKFYAKSVETTGVLDEEWVARALKGSGGGSDDDGDGGGLDF